MGHQIWEEEGSHRRNGEQTGLKKTIKFYLGSVGGVRRLICEKHLERVQGEAELVGKNLLCFVCQEEIVFQKNLWKIIPR